MTVTRVLGLLVVIVAALTWRLLYVAAATNRGSVTVAGLIHCSNDLTCQQTGMRTYNPLSSDDNRTNQLTNRANQLIRALQMAPWSDSIRYRLAEIQFALGRREQAAVLLPSIKLRLPDGPPTDTPADPPPKTQQRTRLLNPNHHEYHLLAGYQQMAAGNWEAATVAFRLAVSLGAEYLTPADHQAYFETLAHQHAQQAEQDTRSGRSPTEPARAAYLAGKYFAHAGRWDQAEAWLRRVQENAGWNDLPAAEQARTWTYLGLAHEQASNFTATRQAYETAINIAPTLREPYARLLMLLQQLGEPADEQRVASTLADLGPTYRLGQFGEGVAQPEPVTLPNGWTLVGYDLDEESLEIGGQLDLWLWWQLPTTGLSAPATLGSSARPRRDTAGAEMVERRPETGLGAMRDSLSARPGRDWLPVGDYWLEHQTVVNLAPNPGFEWGMAATGLPLGFFAKYRSYAANVSIVGGDVPGGSSFVLQVPKSTEGVKSFPLPVDSESLYLTAAWLRGRKAETRLGRHCFPADHPSDHRNNLWGPPSDMMWEVAAQGDGVWTHIAHLGPLVPDQKPPVICQLFLENRAGSAQFDQVLFTKLPAGSLPGG